MAGVAVLAGGVGAARLLTGMVRAVPPAEVTAIVNVGDDAVLHGLSISPDLDTVVYTVAGLLGLAGALALSWIRIEVDPAARELRVDDARLPLDVIAAVTPIAPAERRDLLGRDADPLAFVIQRPWVPGGIRVDLDDPADPTPYWYVSTRRPDELAATIRAARPDLA